MDISVLIKDIDNHEMNSDYENYLVGIISNESKENTDLLLSSFLTHEDFQVRMMGLRLVKRCVRDKDALLKVTKFCFDVSRLTELQKWYSAIFARCSPMLFVKVLKKETELYLLIK